MSEFFAMGGYGAFVWPSYVVALAILLGLTAWSLRAHARVRAELKALEERTRNRAAPLEQTGRAS